MTYLTWTHIRIHTVRRYNYLSVALRSASKFTPENACEIEAYSDSIPNVCELILDNLDLILK